MWCSAWLSKMGNLKFRRWWYITLRMRTVIILRRNNLRAHWAVLQQVCFCRRIFKNGEWNMLTIQIDNAEIEQDLKRAFGEDKASLSHLFNAFLLEKRIKAD